MHCNSRQVMTLWSIQIDKCIEVGLHVNRILRQDYIMDASKELNVFYHKLLVNKGVEMCYLQYEHTHDDQFLHKARKYIDESKGLLFQNKRAQKEWLKNQTEEDSEYILALTQKLDSLYIQNRTLSESMASDMYSAIVELERKLHDVLPTLQEDAHVPRNINYIEYVVTDNNVYAMSQFDRQTTLTMLGKVDTIRDLVRLVRNQLIPSEGQSPTYPEDSIRGLQQKLYSFLLGKFDKIPSSFIVIPDEMIHHVNFDILVSPANPNAYLIERHEIGYAFQFSQLAEKNRLIEVDNLLALAPQYPNDNQKIAMTRGSLYPLEYPEEEIEQIMQLRNESNDVVTNDIGESFSVTLAPFDGFHYAGHALHDNAGSYLAIGHEPSARIYAEEIERMNWDGDLVVLSACETALGDRVQGEGIKSLGRSFAIAGAGEIVQSLWTVNDQSTTMLVELFYENFNETHSAIYALRKAKLDFLKQASPEFRHPYYWAGFVAVGSVYEAQSSWVYLWYLLPILVFIIVVFKFKVK